jgi:sn-glycerol 3-phosphate transport system substrate-binding protein
MINRKWFFTALFSVFAMLAVVPAFAQTPTEIKMWIAFTDYRLDWAQQKAAIFNEQFPQYNVVVEGYPNYEELFNATALASEQGNIPAIVQYFEVATQVARDSGYFKSIEDALAGRTEINGVATDVSDFIAPVSGYYTLDGKFTSMPWNSSSSIMFVNKTQLDAAGVESIPTTWAEVDAACEQIAAYSAANGGTGALNTEVATDGAAAAVPTFCFTWPNHGWFFEQWMAQQDAFMVAPDNGRGTERGAELAFNSAGGLAILNWLKGMQDNGYLYYSGARNGDSWGTVDQAFLSGQVSMAVYSSSDTAYYTNTGNANGFEVVATRLPYNQETGWTGNIIGGASLWLADGLATEVEDGALTWLFWVNNTANAAEWHQVTGYMPISNSSVELLNTADWYATIELTASQVWMDDAAVQASEGAVWFEANPNFLVAADQIADSTITAATSGAIMGDFPAIRNVVTQAIDTFLLTENANAEEVLAAAQAEAQGLLDEYNTLNAQ